MPPRPLVTLLALLVMPPRPLVTLLVMPPRPLVTLLALLVMPPRLLRMLLLPPPLLLLLPPSKSRFHGMDGLAGLSRAPQALYLRVRAFFCLVIPLL
jgi:hypothetical protein